MIEGEETMRYKKKSSRRPPKKAKHKHVYENCVFCFDTMKRFDRARGMIWGPALSVGTYCPICGKIGDVFDRQWYDGAAYQYPPAWNDRAQQEFDPATRTLPFFHLNSVWQKAV